MDDLLGRYESGRARLRQIADGPLTPELWLEALATIGEIQAGERRQATRISFQVGLPRGAKPRLLIYLLAHQGQTMGKDQLSGVAGIYEWARRLRELRVEEGWPIASGASRDDLRPGEYVLEAANPDPGLRERWQTANRIRRMKGSALERLLTYFRANQDRVVAKDELQYVARIQSHARRVRELAEAGWQIESNLDRPELRPGEYVLVSDERLPAKARAHIRLRYEIMERDGQACGRCKSKAGSGRRLQVHHVVPVAHGGLNLPDNLETLCDACHAGVHAVGIAETSDELLNPELEPS